MDVYCTCVETVCAYTDVYYIFLLLYFYFTEAGCTTAEAIFCYTELGYALLLAYCIYNLSCVNTAQI